MSEQFSTWSGHEASWIDSFQTQNACLSVTTIGAREQAGGMCAVGFSEADANTLKISSDLEKAHILQRPSLKRLFITSSNPELAKLHHSRYVAIDTCGDGACALHSLFGSPCSTRCNKLFAANVRARLVATLGNTACEFRQRLRNDELYANVTSALWHDGLYPILLRECLPGTTAVISNTGRIL